MPVTPAQLILFNTLTRRKEPYTAPVARIYVCGAAPVESTHLGHAFTYVAFDVLVRYLKVLGKKVTYVRNVTDLDGDILRRAKEKSHTRASLRDRGLAEFRSAMDALNNLRPDAAPRAGEHISSIDALSRRLIAKGCAYRSGRNVYFHSGQAGFGMLSRLDEADWLPVANAHGNDPGDPLKQAPLDFPLWQQSAPGEPEWDSSFGRGRPGPHIECSALAMEYLGTTIDIHGGSYDLVFPHHEAEIAQSQGATDRQFARVWMHTGVVRRQSEQMSEFSGNAVPLSGMLRQHTPNSVRLMLLLHHYRSSWEHTEAEITAGAALASALRTPGSALVDVSGLRQRFYSALNDDLNTPQAVRVLTGLAAGARDPAANDALREMGTLLGLDFSDGRVAA